MLMRTNPPHRRAPETTPKGTCGVNTSLKVDAFQSVATIEAWSRRGHTALPYREEPPQGAIPNGDFAQDEEEFGLSSMVYLILSDVEGRAPPMQVVYDLSTPSPRERPGRRPGQPPGTRTEEGFQPRHQARMPFCACSRFSASSQTTDCGPSMTAALTSSPRLTGRQCMKIASGLAHAIRRSSTR